MSLAATIVVEASALMEPLERLTEAQSQQLAPEQVMAVEREAANVLLYLIRLSDKLDIDLSAAAPRMIVENEAKWPPEVPRGFVGKSTDL